MRIGIRDGCLQEPWETAFKTAAQIGFDGLEIEIGANHEETLLWTCEGRTKLAQIVKASGIEVASFCAGVCWTVSPASNDPEVRRRIAKILTAACAFAAEFQVRWILVPVTPGGEGVTPEVGTARWIEAMSSLASLANDMGVKLCLENVGGGYGKSAAELIGMVDAVASPGVGVYYDIGNATAFGHDPVEEIETLGNRIGEVHVKDVKGELLGEGLVRIPESLAALRAIGYDDYLVLETPATADPVAAATANLSYLRKLL